MRVILLCIGLLLATPLYARAPDEAEFLAASIMGEDIAFWVDNLEKRPNSIGVFSVRANAPLESDYATIMETEILKQLRNLGRTEVTSCPECRSPQVTVKDDRLIITKGAPDLETLKNWGKKMNVEAFLTVEIYRTKISVFTQVSLYGTGSGELIAAEHFKVPAVNIADSAMQLVLQAGPGVSFGGTNGGSSEIPFAASFMLLEELGFGKGGLTIGAAASSNSIGYILPTLGVRGRVSATSLTYLASLGLGLGITGGPGGKGVASRVSMDLYIGSYALIGAEFTGNMNLGGGGFSGFAGGHVGFCLGR